MQLLTSTSSLSSSSSFKFLRFCCLFIGPPWLFTKLKSELGADGEIRNTLPGQTHGFGQ